jgi:hypothetical protein
MQGFSGVWVGNWSNQLCSALIVEQIDPEGKVTAKYIHGSNPAHGTKANNYTMTGTIVGNTATFRARSAAEFTLRGNELARTFTAPNFKSTGAFKRQ